MLALDDGFFPLVGLFMRKVVLNQEKKKHESRTLDKLSNTGGSISHCIDLVIRDEKKKTIVDSRMMGLVQTKKQCNSSEFDECRRQKLDVLGFKDSCR